MYLFPRVGITNDHKLSGVKEQKFILRVLEAGSLKSRSLQDPLPLKALGRNCTRLPHALPAYGC